MLWSILAQMEYSYQICKWKDAEILFHINMYVPEEHPLTGSEFHERGDFAHVLKVLLLLIKISLLPVSCYIFICREWLRV